MINGYMDTQYWAGYWTNYWPGFGAGPTPVVASTIDSHHTRIWYSTPSGRMSFKGYTKR